MEYMTDRIFSVEKVNIGRQREIDFLKAFSIIMMIITHCVDNLFDYSDHLPSVIIDDILSQAVGASAFMICMGIGVLYSRKGSPSDCFKRGISLLMTGQLLNIFRYAIPSFLIYYLLGSEYGRQYAFLTFSSDILQFAGLFFICLALFTKLKLRPWQILIIAFVMNIIGTLLAFRLDTGIYPVDQLTGMFIATNTESYFPLFNWLVYPAFGMVFGEVLQHVKDKLRFYGILFIPSLIISAVYFYIGINVEQNIFTVFSEWRSFCYVNPIEAFVQLFCNTAMICLAFFVTIKMPDKAMQPVNFVSKNINRYYCVHYLIVEPLYLFGRGMDAESMTAAQVYLIAFVTVILTSAIVWIYDNKLAYPLREFFGKHLVFWYIVIILVSIAFCVWSYTGATEFPNMMNDYFE